VCDVIGELLVLHVRCIAIQHSVEDPGHTIESPEFVDGLWQFAGTLLHFGREIAPYPSTTSTLVSTPPSFMTRADTEGVTLRELLISLMLQVRERVFVQALHYVLAPGCRGNEPELALLSDTALKGARAIQWSPRILIAWNGNGRGLPSSDIAAQLGVPADDVPQWIQDAQAFVSLWPPGPPTQPG
jgi:hypothetical protein